VIRQGFRKKNEAVVAQMKVDHSSLCGRNELRAAQYSASEGNAVDFGTRRLYLAIRRLRLATVSGISSANGAVAEWLKAAVC
jgi:hypothetical protein